MTAKILFGFILASWCLGGFIEANESQETAEQLDRAIKEVIAQREYQWRMPREVVQQEEQGLLFEFLEGVANFMKRVWKPISEWWDKFKEWLRKQFDSGSPPGSSKEWSAGELNVMIIVLIALLLLILVFFLWRHRKRMREAEAVQAEAILPLPDIADENLVADQLPEEGWQRMAQDLLARGELRLALRAMFMATLSYLAQSQFITVAKFKSNREYWQELRRRAYDRKGMQEAFYENVSSVDRVWYGMHPVTDDLLKKFMENVETVKRAA
ncbi:hypothetical protein L0156_06430 [bacterium]|nr:hypothetical protein [bacterium]